MIARLDELTFVSEQKLSQREFAAFVLGPGAKDDRRYELLEGRVVMMAPAGWPHGRIEAALVHELSTHVAGGGLGIVQGSSAGYELPTGDTVEPDASVILNERLHAGPEPEPGRFLRIVPDLAVEIVSPSSERRDRTQKLRVYARAGITEYWLVDPDSEQVTVYRLLPDTRAYDTGAAFGRGTPLRSQLLPDLQLRPEALFE